MELHKRRSTPSRGSAGAAVNASAGDAFLVEGPAEAPVTVALAHGAGAGMRSPLLAYLANAFAAAGLRTVRFEFPYMAARSAGGPRRPPDGEPTLIDAWRAVVARLRAEGAASLVVGGKSLGGRIASRIADEVGAAGLICFGYPFHPPGRPDRLRIEHLRGLKTPCLILQGERDPFGTPGEVAGYPLSPRVSVRWLADGDHGFKPRARSGRTEAENWSEAAAAAIAFAKATAERTGRPQV